MLGAPEGHWLGQNHSGSTAVWEGKAHTWEQPVLDVSGVKDAIVCLCLTRLMLHVAWLGLGLLMSHRTFP